VIEDLWEVVSGRDVVRWNPERPGGDAFGRRVDNFGDLIGPRLVERLIDGVTPDIEHDDSRRLVAVGSILQFGRDRDVVWGAGINGKLWPGRLDRRRRLDVRSVRGPLTRLLLEAEGNAVPEVYGDPALLLPELFPELRDAAIATPGGVAVVPNVNDFAAYAERPGVLSPTDDLWSVVRGILGSSLVVGSSLHAIVIAEAFGVPARLVRSENEHPLKYVDYYRGTGRADVTPATSVDEALDLGGAEGLGQWRPGPIRDAFPLDLWEPDADVPEPVEFRPLVEVAADVVDLCSGGGADGPHRAAFEYLASRVVFDGLSQRADALRDDDAERLVEMARTLEGAGILPLDADGRTRVGTLVHLDLAGGIRRAAFLGRAGRQARVTGVVRAGGGDAGDAPGLAVAAGATDALVVSGILQSAAEAPLDHLSVRLLHSNETAATDLDLVVVARDRLTDTLAWSTSIPIEVLGDGAGRLEFANTAPGETPSPVIARSNTSLRRPRWRTPGGALVRVDCSRSGQFVVRRLETGARA
jgi:pyruvyltransferase